MGASGLVRERPGRNVFLSAFLKQPGLYFELVTLARTAVPTQGRSASLLTSLPTRWRSASLLLDVTIPMRIARKGK